MASEGNDSKLTNYQLVCLGRSITKPNMKSIALGYLELEDENIKNIDSQNQGDFESFNSDVIKYWMNKNSSDHQVKRKWN